MSVKKNIVLTIYKLLKKLNYFKPNDANVITFHSVNPHISKESSVIYIRPEDFEELMQLFNVEFNVISLSELIRKISEKKDIEPKTLVITFDDGYLDNYEYAAPILQKYGLSACFFITSGFIGTNRNFKWNLENKDKIHNMTWNQVKELHDAGFEIGSHTVNHINLGQVNIKSAKEELENSKKQIEDELGTEISLFAYPFGGKSNINEQVMKLVEETGYSCCCSAYGGKVNINSNPFNIERISNYPSVNETLMELDGFLTYYDGKMKFNIL